MIGCMLYSPPHLTRPYLYRCLLRHGI